METLFSQKERPTCVNAGGALFVWGGGRLEVRTPGLHPGNPSSILGPRTKLSGTVAALTATAPDHQPRDWTPRKMTASGNIRSNGLFFQNAVPSINITDWTRYERSLARKEN